MVGDDDDLVAVPDLGVLAEVLLEDADGARAADVVRHEDVDVDPDVVAGLHGVAAGVAGQDLFGQGHRRHQWRLLSRGSGAELLLYVTAGERRRHGPLVSRLVHANSACITPAPAAWSRSAARSTSTRRSTSRNARSQRLRRGRRRPARRPVRRQHLHRHRTRATPRAGRLIRRLHQTNPGAAIVVMGCYATRDPDAVAPAARRRRRSSPTRSASSRSWRPSASTRQPRGHLALRRPSARLRQGAGRLPAQLQLLHHPQRPARRCAAGRRRRSSTEVRAAGRRRLSGDRADRHPPGPLRHRPEPGPAEGGVVPAVAPARTARPSCRATSASA